MDLLPALRSLHIAATVLLAGAWFFRLLLQRAAADAGADGYVRSIGPCAVVLALATWLGWLAAVALAMSGLPAAQALAPDVLGTVVLQTAFGRLWLLRSGLLLLLAALHPIAARRASRAADLLMAVVAASALASIAASGHAIGAHREHLVVDAIHVVAAGLWLGMLPPLWWTIARAAGTRAPGAEQLAVRATRRFGVPGAIAVVALAATGALNAWWFVGAPANLLSTRYGLLVLAKIGLFAAMVLLALANRFVLTPKLASSADLQGALRRLRTSVLAEAVLGAVLLAVVGVLGITPPAALEHSGHPMRHAR